MSKAKKPSAAPSKPAAPKKVAGSSGKPAPKKEESKGAKRESASKLKKSKHRNMTFYVKR